MGKVLLGFDIVSFIITRGITVMNEKNIRRKARETSP